MVLVNSRTRQSPDYDHIVEGTSMMIRKGAKLQAQCVVVAVVGVPLTLAVVGVLLTLAVVGVLLTLAVLLAFYLFCVANGCG